MGNQLKKIIVNNDASVVTVSAGEPILDPLAKWEYGTAEQMINLKFNQENAKIDLKLVEQDNQIYAEDQKINLIRSEVQSAQLAIGAVQTDSVPTQNSANHMTSGAIYNTLKVSNLGFVDEEPTTGSNNLVKSGGIISFNANNINPNLNSGDFQVYGDDKGKVTDGPYTVTRNMIPIGLLKNIEFDSSVFGTVYVFVYSGLTDDTCVYAGTLTDNIVTNAIKNVWKGNLNGNYVRFGSVTLFLNISASTIAYYNSALIIGSNIDKIINVINSNKEFAEQVQDNLAKSLSKNIEPNLNSGDWAGAGVVYDGPYTITRNMIPIDNIRKITLEFDFWGDSVSFLVYDKDGNWLTSQARNTPLIIDDTFISLLKSNWGAGYYVRFGTITSFVSKNPADVAYYNSALVLGDNIRKITSLIKSNKQSVDGTLQSVENEIDSLDGRIEELENTSSIGFADLPISADGSGLESGDAYIESSTNYIKIKMV